MAEMLVRLFNKYDGEDLDFKAKSTGRGDVIVTAENNWEWSKIERTSYNWIILRCPINLDKCSTMRSSEPGNALENPYLHIIAFRLDLELLISKGHKIPSSIEAKEGQEKKLSRPIELITITEEEFDAAKLLKTKLKDPAVIE